MYRLFKLLTCAVIALNMCLSPVYASAENSEKEHTPSYRALLVGCDDFLYAEDTAPIAHTNVQAMEKIISSDLRGFEIYLQDGILNSAASLEYAINWAFGNASDGDVSLLYLCTHGEFDTSVNNPEGSLRLSDGTLEETVTAQQLQKMLDKIEGTKVLLVDACHSGALIGKGVSPDASAARLTPTFNSKDYKVLVSSGASELSWYWKSSLDTLPLGSSYFTMALAGGAGLYGAYPADRNSDGTITLREMYDYLWLQQASSTVQAFPQEDDFPLLVYAPDTLSASTASLYNISFSQTYLPAGDAILEFSFDAAASLQIGCRITAYSEESGWDWDHAVTVDVSKISSRDAAGRWHCSLDLEEFLPADWSYAMAHLLTVGEGDTPDRVTIYTSRGISRRTLHGNPNLSVSSRSRWTPAYRSELEIFVGHSFPLRLTLSVYNESGRLIRRLSSAQLTRPQGLTPNGSLFYWNGTLSDGSAAPEGLYTIRAQALVGAMRYVAQTQVSLLR